MAKRVALIGASFLALLVLVLVVLNTAHFVPWLTGFWCLAAILTWIGTFIFCALALGATSRLAGWLRLVGVSLVTVIGFLGTGLLGLYLIFDHSSKVEATRFRHDGGVYYVSRGGFPDPDFIDIYRRTSPFTMNLEYKSLYIMNEAEYPLLVEDALIALGYERPLEIGPEEEPHDQIEDWQVQGNIADSDLAIAVIDRAGPRFLNLVATLDEDGEWAQVSTHPETAEFVAGWRDPETGLLHTQFQDASGTVTEWASADEGRSWVQMSGAES